MDGIDVDASYNGMTTLYLATGDGEVEVLKELLKHKVNIEIAPEGEKLLILIISQHHCSVVKVLDAAANLSTPLGDGMISYEEFRHRVATPKTPAQLRDSSAIGAYGTSKTASEQLEGGVAQSLNEFYQEIAQMTWEV